MNTILARAVQHAPSVDCRPSATWLHNRLVRLKQVAGG